MLSVLILCMLAASSYALSYDKWVLAGVNTTMGSYVLFPNINPSWDTASIAVEDDIIILGKGECDSNLKFRVCFNDTRFDVSKGWGVFDAATDRMVPELRIIFTELVPQLSFSQKSDKTSLYVEEETAVRITISFLAEAPIKNLTFRQNIPDSITIIDTGEMRLDGNYLVWEWPTFSGDKSLTYKLKLNRHANVTLGANLTGTYPTGARLSKSSVVTLKSVPSPNPLSLTASLSEAQPLLGDTIIYTVKVANSDTYKNTVSNLLISVPGFSAVVKSDNRLQPVGSYLKWSGDVSGMGKEEFEILVRPERTGKYNITAQLTNTFYDELQSKDISSTTSLASKYDVRFKQLSPRILFMLGKKQINSSEQSNVRVSVSNPDPKAILFDINTTFETNLFGRYNMYIERLAPGQERELFYIPFTAPLSIKDSTLTAEFNGTYRTWYYEYFSFSTKGSLLIKGDPNATVQKPANFTPPVIPNITEQPEESNKTDISQNKTEGTGEDKETPQKPEVDVKPDTIFSKIINWFRRLFGGK